MFFFTVYDSIFNIFVLQLTVYTAIKACYIYCEGLRHSLGLS